MTVLRPQRRGGSGEALRALLAADRFRLGRDSERVAANLALHGGVADDRAAAFVGADLPPHGAPSITLGAARGTLGPHSFGFLDNRRGVAAYAAPLPQRPRVGPLAVVCGRRDRELPDIGPLCVQRGLGIAWIVSAGEADPEDVLRFLAADEGTRAVLIAAPALRASSLALLGGKPAVVLGGDPLRQAAVRRAGGLAAEDMEAWLAHAALIEAGVGAAQQPVAVVVGGGAGLVERALREGGLPLTVRTVDDQIEEETALALAEAASAGDALLVVAAEPLALPSGALFVEAGQLERVRALARAIVARRVARPVPAPELVAERAQARAILAEAGVRLGDHTSKRLLKCYGVRVSRQAPAASPTAALRLGSTIGLPVEVAAEPAAGPEGSAAAALGAPRRAATLAELRRAAAVLLDEGLPYVLVREAFPPAPRAHLSVRSERGLGLCAVLAGPGAAPEQRSLLPLDESEAALLARAATSATRAAAAGSPEGARTERQSAATRRLVETLLRVAACAHELQLALELELFVGDQPAVIAADGRRAPAVRARPA